jgi:hypothetical protein
MFRLRRVAIFLMCLPGFLGCQGQPALTQGFGAKIWVGRYQEIEEYLRTAECVSMYGTDPRKATRCTLPPGGPFPRMAWRSLPPGVHRGFWESYKADIAAYEIDKLLKMDMVPPGVERQIQGVKGAAQLWVENTFGVKEGESPDESHRVHWESQLVRMAMFDNLIGNRDRSPGNMIRDAEWNVILLDHSRAFGAGTELPSKMTRIDGAFWTRIESLTRPQLDAALRAWIGDSEIKAILDRRERMRAEVKSLPR